MCEQEPKIGFKTLDLADQRVAVELACKITERGGGTVMIDSASRTGRSHLRLHRDKDGYFVRCGRRGSLKQYLGRCKITYIDGKPELFAFTLAAHDAFEADQRRRWDAKYGAGQECR